MDLLSDVPFLANAWGLATLLGSTLYQISVHYWAAGQVEANKNDTDKFKKNIEVAIKKASKLSLATHITFGLLIIVFVLSLGDRVFDQTKGRLSALEDRVKDTRK